MRPRVLFSPAAILLICLSWPSPGEAATVQCFETDPAPCAQIGEFVWTRDLLFFDDIFTVNNFTTEAFSGLQVSVELFDASTDVVGFVSDPLPGGDSTDTFDPLSELLSAVLSFTFQGTLFSLSLSSSDLVGDEGTAFASKLVYARVEAPEPATLLLLGLGLASGVWRRSRTLRSHH